MPTPVFVTLVSFLVLAYLCIGMSILDAFYSINYEWSRARKVFTRLVAVFLWPLCLVAALVVAIFED